MRKIIIAILITVLFSFGLTGCNLIGRNPERNETYSKEITTRDVIVEIQSSNLYFGFKVRPQIDVEYLKITIGFYDKNNFPVGARTKKLGKVISGNEYSIEFGSNDFTTKELFAISKWKFLEADGTIWGIKQEIKAFCTSHNYDNGYINKSPTCGALGEKIYTCQTCNYKKNEIIPRTEHNWLDCKYSDSNYICDKCCWRCDWKD